MLEYRCAELTLQSGFAFFLRLDGTEADPTGHAMPVATARIKMYRDDPGIPGAVRAAEIAATLKPQIR